MSLTIGIAADKRSLDVQKNTPLPFDSEGYYWFLHPLFVKLYEKTGEYIDLYGDASFEGASLEALRDTLEQGKQMVAAQPETWEVHHGTQTVPVHKELYEPVSRAKFQRFLEEFREIVAKANFVNGRVICFGD